MREQPGLSSISKSAAQAPYVRVVEFLSEEGAQRVLREMLERRSEFRPKGAQAAAAAPAFYRMAGPLPLWGEFVDRFERLAPMLVERFEIDLSAPRLELLGQAYNDGGSFARHSDATAGGPNWQRRLSGIYYVHQRPRRFEGGGLAIHDGKGRRYVIEPDHNSALFFPRDLSHEVLPVRCASHAFEDSRFAVNVWIS